MDMSEHGVPWAPGDLCSFGGALRVHLTCDLVWGEFLPAKKRSKLETPSFMAPATATCLACGLALCDLGTCVLCVRFVSNKTICTQHLRSTIFCRWTRIQGIEESVNSKSEIEADMIEMPGCRCIVWNGQELATGKIQRSCNHSKERVCYWFSCSCLEISLVCALYELAGRQTRLRKVFFPFYSVM